MLRTLGEGGMGVVYEARHVITGRPAAVKVMHPGSLSVGSTNRFLREARAPGRIHHPGIVPVIDAGVDDDGCPYLAFELLVGEDLEHAIARGAVSTGEAVEVALRLLDVLEAAHACGLVHRDVKPANVFLCRDEVGPSRVRLLDFGIARALSPDDCDATRTGAILGTPRYMSPEQLRGEPVDPRADIWGVGALLFHALTGRPPFDADNYNVLVSQVLSGSSRSLASVRPDLPRELCALVDRALSRERDARWPSARAMADALRGIDLTPRLSAGRRLWPVACGAVGIGLLVAALGLGWSLGVKGPGQPPATAPVQLAGPPAVTPDEVVEEAAEPLDADSVAQARERGYTLALAEGRRLAREGDHRAAVTFYRRALDVSPGDPIAECELGWSAVHDGRPGLAAEHLDAAIESIESGALRGDPMQDRTLAACLYNRGLASEARGDLAGARGFYRRSMEVRPHRAVRERLAGLSPDDARGDG